MNKIKPTGPSKEPVVKHISLHKFPYYKQESLHLKSDTLSSQKTKRTNAIVWKFSLTGREDSRRFSRILNKVASSNKKIQELELVMPFQTRFWITDKDLFDLAQALKGLKSLQRLSLKVASCFWSKVTDRGFYYLTKGMARLHFLKSFSFRFSNCQITDIGLNYLSQSLKKLLLLEVIWLQGDQLEKATDKGLKILNSSFNRLLHLQDITLLIFDYLQMTDQSLERINFKRLVSLREVYFSFATCPQLTDRGMHFLTQGLKKLPNLQIIGLDLYECPNFGDKSLHYIWDMMATLPCLKEIYIEFTHCLKITDDGLHDINKTLMKDLISLRKFRLQLFGCEKITDLGLVSFCQFLKKLVDIQRLYVSFSGSDISDFGVKEVIDYMSSRTSLRKIGLYFDKCGKMTDISLKKISDYLKAQSSLKYVTLSVDHSPGTTKAGRKKLIDDTKNLQREKPDLKIEWMS